MWDLYFIFENHFVRWIKEKENEIHYFYILFFKSAGFLLNTKYTWVK